MNNSNESINEVRKARKRNAAAVHSFGGGIGKKYILIQARIF
jgi:hypothetical protein